jgi:hypothetical protein
VQKGLDYQRGAISTGAKDSNRERPDIRSPDADAWAGKGESGPGSHGTLSATGSNGPRVIIISGDPEDEFGIDMALALGFKRASASTPMPESKGMARMASSTVAEMHTGTTQARALPKLNVLTSGIPEKAASAKLPPPSTTRTFVNLTQKKFNGFHDSYTYV